MRAAGNWWRWLSSLVIQDSFPHLLATALLYGGLSLHVEARYGTRRTVVLTIAAALAGNFLDTLIMVSHASRALSVQPESMPACVGRTSLHALSADL